MATFSDLDLLNCLWVIALSEVIRRDGYSYSNEMTCLISRCSLYFKNSTVSNSFVCFTHCRLGCVQEWKVMIILMIVGQGVHYFSNQLLDLTQTHSLSLSRLIVLMWSMNPFSELIKHYRRWKHVLVKDVCDFNEMYKDSRNVCFNIILSCLIPLYFIPLSDDLWTLWGKTLERSSLYIHTHKKKNQRKDLHTSKNIIFKDNYCIFLYLSFFMQQDLDLY